MLTQIYTSFGGPTSPGRYVLDGINFKDCGLCLLMLQGCDDSGECEKTFYADEGVVEITQIASDRFAANYSGVVYREVTLDQEDSTSVPVPNGETVCVDGFTFDVSFERMSRPAATGLMILLVPPGLCWENNPGLSGRNW